MNKFPLLQISVAGNFLLLIVLAFFEIKTFTLKEQDQTKEDQRGGLEKYTSLNVFECVTLNPRTYYGQRGSYWVLYNYIIAEKYFACDESITYTTHADFTFLDNLEPLLERWQGPLSISIYAPGSDFNETLKRIIYLRECRDSSLVRDYVSFHIFFNNKFIPKSKIPLDPLSSFEVDCDKMSSLKFGDTIKTFRKSKNLMYPVNIGRNIAKEMSTTHYVLSSDIEFYPTSNLIPDFLQMIKYTSESQILLNPVVYVLPVFEVEDSINFIPKNKRELLPMLQNRKGISYKKHICPHCDEFPNYLKWSSAPLTKELNVFHVGKRYKPFHQWNPIYIGSKLDPDYDERLLGPGEGRDKSSQSYIMCLLDYEFHILNNAFLVHRIKNPSQHQKNKEQSPLANKLNTTIIHELQLLYRNNGIQPGCFV